MTEATTKAAASLNAETIAAQQAEIRRLEGKLARAHAGLARIMENYVDWSYNTLDRELEDLLAELEP